MAFHGTPGKRVEKNRNAVAKMFLLGIIVAAVGYVIAAGEWPSTTLQDTTAGFEPVETGSMGGVFAGVALLGLGQIFMVIAMVAWGVRYGIESAVPNRSLTEDDFTPAPPPFDPARPKVTPPPTTPPQYQS